MKTPLAALAVVLLSITPARAAEPKPAPPPPPLSPVEGFKALKVPDDLQLEQVLAEPIVAQPLFLNFDERGRLWVVQYLQYPFPAGLKILSEDKFLRAVYDKVPLPPPHGVRGLDKITIHEDTDGDGLYDAHKTFLDGLNVATSFARGRGGVWVLNPPYLLFYPDKNNDDVPDGDPEVHLEGFGLEDTHSNANSLQWGPDGWLYACQGSTVSGHVKHYGVNEPAVHSMGQLIWRYHPETRRYEIYAEGGGNAFGLEIDSKGRVYSGHNGGDTRGFHYVQGGYYQKGFGKHGPLSNPYTFGYFQAMKHPSVPRFTHDFIRYEDAALPERYRGNLLGVHPLGSHVVASAMLPDRSSYQTKDIDKPITSSDPWFRPVHITAGPDGSVYVADLYEFQIAHGRHHEGKIDKSNGRIYRFRSKGSPFATKPFDLARLTTPELVEHLRHPIRWQRREALRLLGDRKDRAAVPELLKRLDASTGQDALEALWGLNLTGGLNDGVALKALDHADPYVRLWTVRLLGDAKQVSNTIAARLAERARTEPNLEARVQLACSARRLPAADGLPIVRGLIARDEDATDVYQPLLLWWALETWCASDRDRVVGLFEDPAVWRHQLVQNHLLHRLMRRFAQAGTRTDLLACARLLRQAPDAEAAKALVRGFEEAYQGRPLGALPTELAEALSRFGGNSVPLGLRQNKPEAVAKALAVVVADDAADNAERLQYITVLGQVNQPRCVPVLLDVLRQTRDDALRLATLTALQSYNDDQIATTIIDLYGKFSDDARSAAQTTLAGRKSWALLLLEAVDQGKIDRSSLALDVVRQLTAHRDDRIARLVAKHWGDLAGAATADMKASIEKLEGVLRTGAGSPYAGKALFKNSCLKCHKLFDQGGQVGPDLTPYQRTDVATLLLNIVNPGAEVREGFETLLVATTDGRLLTGTLVDKDNQVLVLRGADGQNITVRQDQIEDLAPQKKSLMPEGLLNDLTDQQVRDLFAYLRSSQPLAD